VKPTATVEDCSLYLGSCLKVLPELQAGLFHLALTSPPYWGQREYSVDDKSAEIGREKIPDCLGWAGDKVCGSCFVCNVVEVGRAVRRVLRDDGSFVLNLGDTYSGGDRGDVGGQGTSSEKQKSNRGTATRARRKSSLESKNLIGVPWRVALALQADGWILRQEVIWHKVTPMPESVRDRCTRSHEHVFHLVKRQNYFFDQEAIRELATSEDSISETRNKRSVWTLTSESYSGSHFATFPTSLVAPWVKACTSQRGCCQKCGAPWTRVVEREKLYRERPYELTKRQGAKGTGNSCGNSVAGTRIETLGWKPDCSCCGLEIVSDPPSRPSRETAKESAAVYEKRLRRDWQPQMDAWLEKWNALRPKYDEETTVSCRVLDPFSGAATTLLVCQRLGRIGVGVELSKEYLEQSKKRLLRRGRAEPRKSERAGKKTIAGFNF
jgi:DNA modification methylase